MNTFTFLCAKLSYEQVRLVQRVGGLVVIKRDGLLQVSLPRKAMPKVWSV